MNRDELISRLQLLKWGNLEFKEAVWAVHKQLADLTEDVNGY